MKTDSTVTEITRDELVNLFSTGLYGNSYMIASYTPDEKKKVKIAEDNCFEETLADILLGGGKIQLIDIEAEGELYGNLTDRSIDEDDAGVYNVSLDDIKNGLSNILSGNIKSSYTDKTDIDMELNWLKYTVHDISTDGGRSDMLDVYGVIQAILFNEVIYG